MRKAGEIIGARYRIRSVLGRGGTAVTYLAADLEGGEDVAVKELSVEAVEHWRAVELFEREARVLAALDHPAIPRYVDYLAPDAGSTSFILVQALAPGMSLQRRLNEGWRTDERGAIDIAEQVLNALVYLHARSPPVIHRDIKPDNLILDDSGRVTLVDFGAVRATLARQSRIGTIVGTFGYMAPEQLHGQAGPTSDLYALGATLVHILTAVHPADLPHDRLRLSFRDASAVTPPTAAFLDRLLAPIPEDRYRSAATALRGLEGARHPAILAAPRSGTRRAAVKVRWSTSRDVVVLNIKSRSGWLDRSKLAAVGGVTAALIAGWMLFRRSWSASAALTLAAVIGGGVAGIAAVDALVGRRARLTLTPEGFTLEHRGLTKRGVVAGRLRDIAGIDRQPPLEGHRRGTMLRTRSRDHVLGLDLSPDAHEAVVDAVAEYLGRTGTTRSD